MATAPDVYFEMYQSEVKDGRMEWRWRLKHHNGKIMADSGEGYFRKSDCEHGIAVVKASSSAEVREEGLEARIARLMNKAIGN